MRDLKPRTQLVDLGVVTLSGTTPAASAWVDLRGFDAVELICRINAITTIGSGYTLSAQHGDSSVGASAVAIAAGESTDGVISLTSASAGSANTILGTISYKGSKRYLRINAVGTATTAMTVTIVAVLTRASQEPTVNVGTSVAAT